MSETTLASSPQGVRCYSHPILKDFRVSDWSRRVTWAEYWSLIGREGKHGTQLLWILFVTFVSQKNISEKNDDVSVFCPRLLNKHVHICSSKQTTEGLIIMSFLYFQSIQNSSFLPLYVGKFWGRYCNKLPFLTFEQSSLDQALKEQGFMSV